MISGILDLRDLASELRDELGYCTTGCGDCNGDGNTDVDCDYCGGGGSLADGSVCVECAGEGTLSDTCSTCDGEGEIFDVRHGDSDKIEALVDLAGELVNSNFDLTHSGIDSAADELQSIGDNYECTLIPEDEFEDYAQELAEDLMPSPEARELSDQWPFRHIDWEAAAAELRYDYTSVKYAGHDYLIRSW